MFPRVLTRTVAMQRLSSRPRLRAASSAAAVEPRRRVPIWAGVIVGASAVGIFVDGRLNRLQTRSENERLFPEAAMPVRGTREGVICGVFRRGAAGF